MGKDFVYQDDAGKLRLLSESRKVGDRIIGPRGVVLAERVIPMPRYSPPRLFGPDRQMQARRRLIYLYLRGIIFWAEESGSYNSGQVTYRKIWPVLKNDFRGDLAGLVDRIFINRLDGRTDIPMIDSYLVRADNFFVSGKRAWFSNRFHLFSGPLADGKNFRGGLQRVGGVPKDNDPGTDYNHIIRCWVYQDNTSTGYRMLTEERVMRSSGLRRAYENNRAVINEYTSGDLLNWSFSRTVGEDFSIDRKDHDKKTPIPGLPVNYKRRIFEHIVGATAMGGFGNPAAGGHELPLRGTVTELSSHLGELFPQPGEIYIEKAASGYRAYLNRFGVNTTWSSGDGLSWSQESTQNVAYSRQGNRVGGTSVVLVGKRR